jgi:DNA polymerase-3 subunit gamma/tau
MSRALYRKYRARKLSEIRGQDHITAPLSNALQSGKVSHAYLLTGPRGTGKTSVARILAHELNGFDYELEDSYIDIVEIDAASNTGVDNIRDLRERATIAPTQGRYKVYIIDEVHMLSKSAFNALLKTLEEPPAHVIFVMATTDPQKVPVTILSRAQQYQFRLADTTTMIQHLRAIADAEQIKITDDALQLIAERGGGSFRDSLSLLDQLSTLSTKQIDRTTIESALGLPSDQLISQLLTGYTTGDQPQLVKTLSELTTLGIKPELIAEQLITKITAAPDATLLPLLDRLTDVARNQYPAAKLLLALLADLPSQTPKVVACPIETTDVEKSDTLALDAPQSDVKKPDTPPKGSPQVDVSGFSYDAMLDTIATKSQILATKLQSLKYTFDGRDLTIYAANKVNEKLLKTDKNRLQITSALPEGVGLVIVAGRKPADDPAIAQLSDIIGIVEEVEVTGVFGDAAETVS